MVVYSGTSVLRVTEEFKMVVLKSEKITLVCVGGYCTSRSSGPEHIFLLEDAEPSALYKAAK